MTTPVFAAPSNIEAERRVLGTLLVFYKPQLVHIIQATGVKWSDFYVEAHRVVYRAVLKLHAKGDHIDTVTVSRFLQCQQHERAGTWLELAGGATVLELLSAYATVNGYRECAVIVAEDGRWRRWLEATFGAMDAIRSRDEDAFWAWMARVREDVFPAEPGLRVIDGAKESAA